MKKHTKLYLDYFGYLTTDFVKCECCGAKAVDIHHINPRGIGGTKEPDRIENLQALCRQHHQDYGDRKQFKNWLFRLHQIALVECGKPYDKEWLNQQIEKHIFVSRDEGGNNPTALKV